MLRPVLKSVKQTSYEDIQVQAKTLLPRSKGVVLRPHV
jgi:hypothetical protein